MTHPKSEADKAKQRLFEKVRHLVGSKHQCPEHLSLADLWTMIDMLTGTEDDQA